MASEELVALVFILAFMSSWAKIPDGYILQISPDCGSDAEEDAEITIVTDLRAAASAICENDTEVNFINLDGVNIVLPVSYPNAGNNSCVFQKRQEAQIYVIIVLISWGEPGNPVHSEEEEFFVTCTFDENGQQLSNTQVVEESLVAPIEIQTHLGNRALSSFTLVLSDVLGQPVSGSSVALGRLVLLIATSDGASGEKGVRPVACDAVGSSTGRRYAIIRAGCGDGVVFSQTEGFITENTTAMSPYFGAFDMAGDPAIQFECNFTLCNDTCDGSSCANDVRDKRASGSTNMQEGQIIRLTDIIELSPLDQDSSVLEENGRNDEIHTGTLDDKPLVYLGDVFWVILLCIGIISIMSISISTCVYLIKRRKRAINLIE